MKIAGTHLADTGTALELLGKMPFVTRSGSEIEVLGKGSPLIYINGRQVRDMSELDQLASAQIKNIDIVANPGARYASTVNSVIRITTVAPAGDGFSLNDRTTAGYKHYAYLFEQVNLNWRKNGLDLFGMLNYENYRERTGVSNSSVQYLRSGIVKQKANWARFCPISDLSGKDRSQLHSGLTSTRLLLRLFFQTRHNNRKFDNQPRQRKYLIGNS